MKKLILITALIASTCLATLSPIYAPAQYDCNGSVVNFTVSWQFFAKTDLQVYIVDSDGVSTLLTEGAGAGKYTVYAPNSDYSSGARITTGSTYASGNRISISRVVPDGQELSINGDFIPAKPLEQQLDKLAAQNQQTANDVGLTLSFPDTDPSGLINELPAAENRANKMIQFDSVGNVTVISPIESGAVYVDTEAGLSIVTNVISAEINTNIMEFVSGKISVKAGGIKTTNILAGDITTALIDDEAVTLAKMADLGNYTVIGNVSGASATPAEVAIIDDDTMGTAASNNLSSAESIKAYVDALEFGASLTANGYQKLPSGLIIQWGTVSVPRNTTASPVAMPITFPTASLFAIGAFANTSDTDNGAVGATVTTSQITIRNSAADGDNPADISWIAIGY